MSVVLVASGISTTSVITTIWYYCYYYMLRYDYVIIRTCYLLLHVTICITILYIYPYMLRYSITYYYLYVTILLHVDYC